MGVQIMPIQKTYEIAVGSDLITIDFLRSNRQFDCVEIFLVYNKSDKHNTIYDRCNTELAAKYIKSVKLSTFAEIYSLTNEKKYDVDSLTQKHLLYKQFVAWSCNGCSAAPLTNYINNPVYQELIDKNDNNGVRSDDRVYLYLRASSGYTPEEEKLERNNSKMNH